MSKPICFVFAFANLEGAPKKLAERLQDVAGTRPDGEVGCRGKIQAGVDRVR